MKSFKYDIKLNFCNFRVEVGGFIVFMEILIIKMKLVFVEVLKEGFDEK